MTVIAAGFRAPGFTFCAGYLSCAHLRKCTYHATVRTILGNEIHQMIFNVKIFALLRSYGADTQ